jgi:hypothetical protein
MKVWATELAHLSLLCPVPGETPGGDGLMMGDRIVFMISLYHAVFRECKLFLCRMVFFLDKKTARRRL